LIGVIKMEVETQHLTSDEMKEQEKVAVRDVLLTSYQQYEQDFEKDRWRRYRSELNAAVEHSGTDRFIIAKVTSRIIGTMQLFPTATEAYSDSNLQIDHPIIRFLAVHPRTRGLGVAKNLLDQAVIYANSKQADAISLHTTEMMTAAVRLYETYGFKRNACYDYTKYGSTIQCYTLEL